MKESQDSNSCKGLPLLPPLSKRGSPEVSGGNANGDSMSELVDDPSAAFRRRGCGSNICSNARGCAPRRFGILRVGSGVLLQAGAAAAHAPGCFRDPLAAPAPCEPKMGPCQPVKAAMTLRATSSWRWALGQSEDLSS